MHARVHGHVHVRACSSTLVICPSPSMSIWSKSSSACHMHIYAYTHTYGIKSVDTGSIHTHAWVAAVRGIVRHRTPEAGTRTAYLQQGLTRAKLPCASGTYSTARRRPVRVRVARTAAALYGCMCMCMHACIHAHACHVHVNPAARHQIALIDEIDVEVAQPRLLGRVRVRARASLRVRVRVSLGLGLGLGLGLA